MHSGAIEPTWNLVTSHGLVLLYVAAHNDATVRELAQALGYTDRRIASLIKDLNEAGLLVVRRSGRRNHYELDPDARFRHRLLSDLQFSAFVDAWQKERDAREE